MQVQVRKLAFLIRKPGYWRAASYGVIPTIEHANALGGFKFSTVLDVGANKGQFALFARSLWPEAEIHCFEPLGSPRATLSRLLDKYVRIYDCALGSAERQGMIHVANRKDSSSLLPIGERQRHFYRTEDVGQASVAVKRLDTLLSAEDVAGGLLKIDVQGYEYEVLLGAKALLGSLSALYVECSFVELYEGQRLAHEVIELLQHSGFMQAGVFNTDYRDGHLVQADLLFLAAAHSMLEGSP